MELNPLVLVGGAVAAVAAYAFSEKKKTEDTLVAQALPVAAQQVQMGVPVQQAAQSAAANVIVNTAVKNAVPVAVQLIKTGTPTPAAIAIATQSAFGTGGSAAPPSTPPGLPYYVWTVTWTFDSGWSSGVNNANATYETEERAIAQANDLRVLQEQALKAGGTKYTNIKVEKKTLFGKPTYARME